LDPDAAPAAHYIAAKFNGHLLNLARTKRPLQLTDFYSGNFSISRRILEELGGFDEDFDEYGNEDLELSFRLACAGVQLVYDANAIARQHNDKTFAALAADSVSEGRTAVRFALKHPEAYPRLKLGTFAQGPRLLLLLRNCLLRFSPRNARAPAWLISLEAALARINPPGMSAFYRLALGYLYWLGAREAIQAVRDRGRSIEPLSRLARDLRL
jgi:GT2 family glycosyltransferase